MRRLVMVAVAAVICLVGLALLLTRHHGPRVATPPAKPVAEANLGPRLQVRDAQGLADRLLSPQRRDVRRVLAVPRSQALDPGLLDYLRTVHDVELDVGSYRRVDDAGGTVAARVTSRDGGVSTWLLTVVRIGGEWHILTTEPLG